MTNKNQPATHVFLDLKKNETKKNFIYHLVQQNLRLQMNRTDFKVLYIFFCPRINKIFSILYSRPTEICIITASTSDGIVQRGTALYNLQKKDRTCVCVWRHMIRPTHTNTERHWPTTFRGKTHTINLLLRSRQVTTFPWVSAHQLLLCFFTKTFRN